MREKESNYSVRCQRVSGWVTEGELGRQRVKSREGKKNKNKNSQRVDATLGVKKEG